MNPEMSYALFLFFAHSRVGVYVCVCMLASCSRKGRVSCREQFGHRVPRTAHGSARASSAGQARVNTPFSHQNCLAKKLSYQKL